jgi:23S rRNA pseudouridine1911/1915/1917 synthase
MGLGDARRDAIQSETDRDYMVQPRAPAAADAAGAVPESGDVEADGDVDPGNPGGSEHEPPERREALVPQALHGQRLDKAVVAMASEFSRNHLQGLIEAGHVRVEGAVVSTSSRKVLAGQALTIELVPTAESRAFRPEALPIAVVFEDEHLLVVNKAAGTVVHPA